MKKPMVADSVNASKPVLHQKRSYSAATRKPNALSLEQQMRVRTLYLIKDEPPSVIAKQLGVDRQVIYDLVSKRGWAKMRAKIWSKADAQITADIEQVSHAIATESEELTFGTLQMLRESIDQRDAKSAQMASGAARNLVDIARRSRGLDNQIQGQSAGGNVNFFVLQGVAQPADRPAKEVKNVTDSVSESQIRDI